jgi:hypothetical protein
MLSLTSNVPKSATKDNKGRYVFYHCTNFHGACGSTYIREERLGNLLGDCIRRIQITLRSPTISLPPSEQG